MVSPQIIGRHLDMARTLQPEEQLELLLMTAIIHVKRQHFRMAGWKLGLYGRIL